MRIAFDSQTFAFQEYGGISRYICSLAKHLSEFTGDYVKIFAPIHINAYLPKLPENLVTGIRVPVSPKAARIIRSISNTMAIPIMKAFHPDIVHETYYSNWVYAPKGARRVITAHDMIHERFPDNFSPRDPTSIWKKNAFSRVDRIICISESTRNDLQEIFKIPENKISVIYHGFDTLTAADEHDSDVSCIGKTPYILYVGNRGGYKNFTSFVQAYTSSEWLLNNFNLVCFGGGSFTVSEKKVLKAFGIKEERILQIGGNDAILAACYRNAAAFVYPSIYEGFGIPPLEAMSLGCPVVCSNTSSVPEVAGDAGEYFDPKSIESMRVAIEKVLQSSERRTELITLGKMRCSLFTWNRCAAETIALYRSII